MRADTKTAIIVVDLQKELTCEWGGNYYKTADQIMEVIPDKLREMRSLGAHLVYIWSKASLASGLTSEASKNNPELAGRIVNRHEQGVELDDRLEILPGDSVIRKYTYSAFWGTPLLETLLQKGVENVVVCGIKTNVCCRTTAIDAVSHGFKTFMISDMVSTNTEELSQWHLEELNKYWAKVIDSDEVITRLREGRF